MDDDLNTPGALALVSQLVTRTNQSLDIEDLDEAAGVAANSSVMLALRALDGYTVAVSLADARGYRSRKNWSDLSGFTSANVAAEMGRARKSYCDIVTPIVSENTCSGDTPRLARYGATCALNAWNAEVSNRAPVNCR